MLTGEVSFQLGHHGDVHPTAQAAWAPLSLLTRLQERLSGDPGIDRWLGVPGVPSIGNTTGSVVFDLGDLYSVERFAIWQGGVSGDGSDTNTNGITLETSSDPAFTTPITVGSFNVPRDNGVSAWPVNDFDLTDSVGRYVRLNITSNHGDDTYTKFGELAFDVTAVPEASPCLMLLAVAGVTVIIRRLRRHWKQTPV